MGIAHAKVRLENPLHPNFAGGPAKGFAAPAEVAHSLERRKAGVCVATTALESRPTHSGSTTT